MPDSAARKLRHADTSALRRRLLVIELGSAAVAQVRSDDYDETVAIPQLQGEQPVAFMQRVVERIASLEQSGGTFDAAVLMTGTRNDDATRLARRMLASGIGAHSRAGAELSDVVVDADASATPRVRQELLELVDELVAGCDPRQAIPIRLRFTTGRANQGEPTSGVFWSVPPGES